MFFKTIMSRRLFFLPLAKWKTMAFCLLVLLNVPRVMAMLTNGVDPNNLGQGDWIWEMASCETALGVSTPQAVIDYEATNGMQWVCVKAADGHSYCLPDGTLTSSLGSSQWTTAIINEAHAKGLKIFAWAYAYGNNSGHYGSLGSANVATELFVATNVLALGGDGFIIDAEIEYETNVTRMADATLYSHTIKTNNPNLFLAHAPFPYISLHSGFPYVQFGTNCDAVMPQDYWADFGISLTNMVYDMDGEWSAWQNSLTGFNTNAIKPIIPIGQGWNSSGYTQKAADITNFVWLLRNDPMPAGIGGYHGVSYWECSQHPAAGWAGIKTSAILSGTNSVTVMQGSNATFTVNVPSGGNYHYQWKFNQNNIASGGTDSSYTVTNAQLNSAGLYSVVAVNPNGSTLNYSTVLSVVGVLTNAPGSILAPTNMVNWWAGEGNSYDIFGVTNATPNTIYYTNSETGLGVHFNGATSYLKTGAPGLAPPWTVCMWVNRQNAPGVSAALMSDTGADILKLEQSPSTREVGITVQGVADNVFPSGYIVPQNTWTHLAFVDNGSQVELFANGVSQGTLALSFSLPRAYLGLDSFSSSSGISSKAGRKFTDYMLGNLDDILVFKRALSSSEIASIYTAGNSGLVCAAQFTGVTNLNNGQIQMNIIGQTGKSIALYSSPDLLNWTSLGLISNPTGATNYTDSTASGAQKFYQAGQTY